MKPKKSLGQNFLTSEAAVYKIVNAAKILPGETVLEVGPGRGVLTKALIEAGANVTAVEKDHELVNELSKKFSTEIETHKLKIIEADILNINPEDLGLKNSGYKIVANIPYYITGELLRKFLESKTQPSLMVLLLQKEVVERIIAIDLPAGRHGKKESILSISVKAYGEPKKITVVNRGSFHPAPNVDSAVILIENISKKFFDTINEEKFFEVVKAGFAHKRKMLVSNLTLIASRENITKIFAKNNISEKIRAEDLTLEQWRKITDELSKIN